MYGIDDDLAGHYDPKKVASQLRTPRFPTVGLQCDGLLKSVTRGVSKNYGPFYEFKFVVSDVRDEKSAKWVKDENSPLRNGKGEGISFVVEEAEGLVVNGVKYSQSYYPGIGEIKASMFWRNITPLLMAVNGEKNAETFNAMDALGNLLTICKRDDEDEDSPEIELDLPFRLLAQLGHAKPRKDGTTNVDKEGQPKIYREDTFSVKE